MKKIIALIMTLVLCSAVLLSCGSAADKQSVDAIKKRGELVVYTNAEFAPFEYLADGKPVGVDMDIAKAIADEIGVELKIENVKFDTIISSVQSGKASLGAAGITVTDERKESVDFSISYTTSTQYVILPEDATYENITDLKGMKIGVQLGTTGDFIISDEVNGYKDDDGKDVKGLLQDTGATVTTYNNANLAAEALKSGKIQAVVIDKLPAELIVKNSTAKLKAVELVYEDGSNTAESYAICVAKGNKTLLEVVNKVVQKLLDEGKIDEYIVKHSTDALA
ncbi:MAG: transporter substrate-binding domain-containing protein [Ruminococcaceae bacterium]|nr:transporter substrate-binding domain-containing protein [Oscillospiraceae bacterium]